MACARWLYHRVWCGGFPRFHLPAEEEAASEQRLSQTWFSDNDFFELRMQIRLKLTETPPITHRRPTPSLIGVNEPFDALFGLLERYVAYLLALERVMSRSSAPADAVELLPSPLFHGLGGVDLDHEAQSSNRWLAVEKTLVYFAMAQLRGVQAELRTARGLQAQDDRTLTRAAQEWASCHRLACLAAAAATPEEGPSVSDTHNDDPAARLLKAAAAFSHALAHLYALRQIATHLSSFALKVEQSERLARVTCAFARRALLLARDAVSVLQACRLDVDLARQLLWCLEADAVRWRAIQIHCEQTVFQLDANPELALTFAEILLTLKLPAVPAYSRRDAVYFTRITQELQLAHSSQTTQALDDKQALLRACQQRYGPTWTPFGHAKVRHLALDSFLEPLVGDQVVKQPGWDAVMASVSVEDVLMLTGSAELEAAITRSVQRVQARKLGLKTESESDSSSTTQVSTYVVVGDEDHHQPGDTGMRRPASLGQALAHQLSVATALPRKRALVKLPPRPSSAQPSLATSAPGDPVDSRAWVSIQHAGKTLHFERATHGETAEDRVAARRNAVPLADPDNIPDAVGSSATKRFERLTTLKRPASSPSYLSPATIKNQSALLPTPAQRLWTPTRFSCALCEQRFMRCNLPGVAVMKRVFDLRRKWGVVIHAAKKFAAPSALYAKANVCLMCQEILQFDDDSSSTSASASGSGSDTGEGALAASNPVDDVGIMIQNAVTRQWDQQHRTPHGNAEDVGDKLQLVDAAQRKRARQSSIVCGMAARYAVQPDSERCAHTKEERQPWWEVDLANYDVVHSVKMYLRAEASRLYGSAPSSSSNASIVRRQQQSGAFPLHVVLSMKSGVGRDLDDVLASCVSSHRLEDKDAASVGAGALMVAWTLPPNARGRFVRVQSERVALLHIERVHVFVAQVPLSLSLLADAGAKAKSDARRRKLQRAAFRASVIAGSSGGPSGVGGGGAASAGRELAGQQDRRASRAAGGADSLLLSSLLDQPEQAEKKRLSKLYVRFRCLLEQRSRYDSHDASAQSTPDTQVQF